MRECGSCTKCCEGGLSIKINGQEIYGKGCPLVLLNKGCSIYEDPSRPSGCHTFSCGWLKNPDVPEEFKPDLVDTIIIFPINDPNLIGVAPANEKISPEVLTWANTYSKENKLELYVQRKVYLP